MWAWSLTMSGACASTACEESAQKHMDVIEADAHRRARFTSDLRSLRSVTVFDLFKYST